MIAKYNGELYEIVRNGEKYQIITYQDNKASQGFTKHKDLYFKTVSDDDIMLTDIFDVEFCVYYNTGLPSVQSEWRISLGGESIKDEKVRLRFAEGYLPGWEVEEKGVCVKEIELEDVLDSKIIYKYIKREGIKLESPYIEEKNISKEELKSMYDMYKKGNL